jgi:hypothetical protein
MKDEVRYAALVVRIILDRLADAGIDGRLAPQRRSEVAFPYDHDTNTDPDAGPYDYDANADLYTDVFPLTELDERGLPPGFPDGFPVPQEATLVLAQRCRDGAAEHAAWRHSTGAFTGYLQRLRAYGCTFGAVPRLLTVGTTMDVTARYTLWRDGAGGSVTLYQPSPTWPPDSPRYCYVSVVWQPHAEPPDTTVDPDETPDTRPVPSGPAAAREVAEFLVPAELVAGYEMVVALATAANAVDQQVSGRPDPADRRPIPVVAADRFASILGRLDAGQLTIVRHACLTMVANILASKRGRRRPDGLTLVPDEGGHLYAADLRQPVVGVIEPHLLPAFEAGVALVTGVPRVVEALSGIRSAPVQPPADRYSWLFTGLDPEQMATTRDACWRILEP